MRAVATSERSRGGLSCFPPRESSRELWWIRGFVGVGRCPRVGGRSDVRCPRPLVRVCMCVRGVDVCDIPARDQAITTDENMSVFGSVDDRILLEEIVETTEEPDADICRLVPVRRRHLSNGCFTQKWRAYTYIHTQQQPPRSPRQKNLSFFLSFLYSKPQIFSNETPFLQTILIFYFLCKTTFVAIL